MADDLQLNAAWVCIQKRLSNPLEGVIGYKQVFCQMKMK